MGTVRKTVFEVFKI